MNVNKQKGTIGELLVAAELTKKGYYVFSELGDNAPIDLIAVPEDNLKKVVRIQVKSTTSNQGKITVYLTNNTRSYSRKYGEFDFDIFAIFVEDLNCILYIALSTVYKNNKTLTLRTTPPKNNQVDKVNFVEDYKEIEHALLAQW